MRIIGENLLSFLVTILYIIFSVCVTPQEYKCETTVDPTTLLALVPQWVYTRWQQRVHSKAVERSGQWRWCPNARCDLLAKSQGPPNGGGLGEFNTGIE